MAAITEQELADLLEEAYDLESDNNVNPEQARRRIAEKQAAAIAQFVIGREVEVPGVQSGTSVATGIVLE